MSFLVHFSFTLALIRQCFFLFLIFFCFVFYFFKLKLFDQYLLENLWKQQLRGILLNAYIFNLINFMKLLSLLVKFNNTQETFQHYLNIVVRVIWHRNIWPCQINIETMLCMSTLKYTTLNKIKSTMLFSTLMLTTLVNIETMLWIWSFSKSWKKQKKYFCTSKTDESFD